MMKKTVLIVMLLSAAMIQAQAQTDFVKTPKGALVKNLTNNPGAKIKVNDVVTFEVIQKTEKDSILFSTYAMHQPIKIQVQPSRNAADLMDVLTTLAVKDSAYVKVPVDSIFAGHEKDMPPFLTKGTNVIAILKIDRVQSLEDAMAERNKAMDSLKAESAKAMLAENATAAKYITDHKLAVTTTASGLKYLVTRPTYVKRKPLMGDTVYVNYTGKLLNGTMFDSSVQSEAQKGGLNQPGRVYEPLVLEVGTNPPVIQGWTEALLLMNEGSKATFIIPSSLGYGETGNNGIPPFATLLFDLELVKIKPIKHPAMAPKAKPGVKKAPVKHTAAKKKS